MKTYTNYLQLSLIKSFVKGINILNDHNIQNYDRKIFSYIIKFKYNMCLKPNYYYL